MMSNAVKFTDKNGVVLRLSLEQMATGGPRIAFAVEDTGIGIPEEEQSHVF